MTMRRSTAPTGDFKRLRRAIVPPATVILLPLLLFWLPGCSKKSLQRTFSILTEKLADYYPLDVENYWVYQVTHPGGTREVKERVIYRRYDVYHIQISVNGISEKDNVEVLQLIENDAIIDKEGVTVLKKPLVEGEQWSSMDMLFEITAKGRPVSVPVGDFEKTLELTWTSKFPKDKYREEPKWPTLDPGPDPYIQILTRTFAKGVGIVKEEFDTITPDGEKHHIYTAELIQYKLRDKDH